MNGAALSVPDATLAVRHLEPDGAVLELAGHWLSQRGLPESSGALSELQSPRVSHLAFDAREVAAWDAGLVTFVLKVLGEMQAQGIAADRAGLPDGVRRLIAMAEAVPEQQTGRTGAQPPWLARLGTNAIATARAVRVGLGFLGESLIAFGALVRRRARFRMSDLLLVVQDCGPRALGIVSLISFHRVVAKIDAQIEPLLVSLKKSSDTAGTTLERAQVTLAGVDGTLNQDSALGYELVKSLQELRETLRALGSLADYLERNPSALLYGARRPSANGGR